MGQTKKRKLLKETRLERQTASLLKSVENKCTVLNDDVDSNDSVAEPDVPDEASVFYSEERHANSAAERDVPVEASVFYSEERHANSAAERDVSVETSVFYSEERHANSAAERDLPAGFCVSISLLHHIVQCVIFVFTKFSLG